MKRTRSFFPPFDKPKDVVLRPITPNPRRGQDLAGRRIYRRRSEPNVRSAADFPVLESADYILDGPAKGDAMRIVDVETAQAELDALIDEACAGEEIIISLDSVPVARLIPVDQPQRQGVVIPDE